MRKRYLIGLFSVILLISMGVTWKLKISVRPPLAKELLDLPYIVNKVDELGGEDLQLNWQEIVSIIAVDPKKDLSQISEEELQQQASLFISHYRVLSFDEVLNQLDLNEKEKKRAYENLNQLKHYGYIPSKTNPQSFEMRFIESIKAGAIENYELYGILPSITIAQAILESDWGQSDLANQANNLFGIKKGTNWSGEVMSFETKEGFDEYIIDEFRSYPSLNASIIDHGQFLVANSRYTKSGVFEAKTYKTQAKALEEAGYSTAKDENGDKIYAKMLGQLIRQYNLQLIDHAVLY
ncbi:glycoside hydrolase family 73 protein [Turicibacter bilis]|uniref:glycoside hydrolase family 73 protein n=1 Tax=Turicibacter bilis TaxID=2735723 RepID=UPI0031BABF54